MTEISKDIINGMASTKKHSPFTSFFIRLVKEKPMGTLGAVMVLILFFTGIFANLIAPYPYSEIHMIDRLAPPSAQYLLGADNMGRDLLSRIIYGARISMYVGLGASAINVIVATFVGLLSGYLGGKFDLVVQRFVDALLTFPMLVVLITLMALIGTGLIQVIIVLGIWGGIGWIRVVRSAVIAIRENVYVDAAQVIGCSTREMIFNHILPNVMPIMIIIFSVSMAGNILAEASLSFLGLGIPPPIPSWGRMLSGEGRRFMYEATWLAIWPGVALTFAVFGISMFGDAVRDLLDPRLRGGVGGMGGYGIQKAQKALGKMKSKTAKKT